MRSRGLPSTKHWADPLSATAHLPTLLPAAIPTGLAPGPLTSGLLLPPSWSAGSPYAQVHPSWAPHSCVCEVLPPPRAMGVKQHRGVSSLPEPQLQPPSRLQDFAPHLLLVIGRVILPSRLTPEGHLPESLQNWKDL